MRRPRGSVLALVLILMSAMLLTAIGATQSSLLELAMGGNELYRLRAFAAAEAGIAETQVALAAAPAGITPAARSNVAVTGMSGDSYDITLRDGGDDARLQQRSGGAQLGHHFTIAATGHSLRGAQVNIDCGVRVVRDPAGSVLAVEREFWLRRDVD